MLDYLYFLIGLILLLFGSHYFVRNASLVAVAKGIDKAIFGTLVVALGTSLPELFVTIESSVQGRSGIVIGNILGSNIANVGLILGVALLLGQFQAANQSMKFKNQVTLIVSVGFAILVSLGLISAVAGLILITISLVMSADRRGVPKLDVEHERTKNYIKYWSFIIIGLLGVIFGAGLLVESSVSIAQSLDVPNEIIAGTLIALGTSLPELAVTLTALRYKEHGIAVGNIIGSNLFNLTLIGGIGMVIAPAERMIHGSLTAFFIIFSVLLYLIVARKISATRWTGLVLVVIYLVYVVTTAILGTLI